MCVSVGVCARAHCGTYVSLHSTWTKTEPDQTEESDGTTCMAMEIMAALNMHVDECVKMIHLTETHKNTQEDTCTIARGAGPNQVNTEWEGEITVS